MKLILINVALLNNLEELFKTGGSAETTYLESIIDKLNKNISELKLDNYSNIDWKILDYDQNFILKSIDKIKSDLALIKNTELGNLSSEFKNFLYLSAFEFECNQFYSDFWYFSFKGLEIDEEFETILNDNSFFEKSIVNNYPMFFAERSSDYQLINFSSPIDKLVFNSNSDSLVTKKADIVNSWIEKLSDSNFKLIKIDDDDWTKW